MTEERRKMPSVMYFFVKYNNVSQRQSDAYKWLKAQREVYLRYIDVDGE